MSLSEAEKLWKLKQDMPIDGDDIKPLMYDSTHRYGTAITIDYSFFKELKIMGLLEHE